MKCSVHDKLDGVANFSEDRESRQTVLSKKNYWQEIKLDSVQKNWNTVHYQKCKSSVGNIGKKCQVEHLKL